MKNRNRNLAPNTFSIPAAALLVVTSTGLSACSEGGEPAPATGGTTNTGGATGSGGFSTGGGSSSGGSSSGGSSSGGASSGGTTNTGGGGGEEIEPIWSNVVLVLETRGSCWGGECHDSHFQASGFGGEKENFYSVLLDPEYVSEICGGKRLVVPNQPDQSALLDVIDADGCTTSEGEVIRMPRSCIRTEEEDNCINLEYVEIVRQWIANGAMP